MTVKSTVDGKDMVYTNKGWVEEIKEKEKNKMTKKVTNVVFLLDETGSMHFCKEDTIGGFNQFLQEQQDSKNNIKFSLTLFNSIKIEKRYVNTAIKDVKPLTDKTYVPSNCTPLWDAIGSTICSVANKKKVLFVILTDGLENASREFTPDIVKELIKDKEENNKWDFLFLGADLSNFNDSHQIGIHTAITIDKHDLVNTYSKLSSGMSTYCTTGNLSDVVSSLSD